MGASIYKNIDTIFFDFDGVIKDSVEVKSDAFEQLFTPFGDEIALKVRNHHELHGGISRYDKFPLYLRWVGKEPSYDLVKEYSKRLSKLAKQNVIDSEWVPGILEFLGKHANKNMFFLVTATPQSEMEDILSSLNIKHFFKEVIGSPIKKSDAINSILNKYSLISENSIMIGDSTSDYQAAKLNGVPFLLRRTPLNKELQAKLNCEMIDNFLALISSMDLIK